MEYLLANGRARKIKKHHPFAWAKDSFARIGCDREAPREVRTGRSWPSAMCRQFLKPQVRLQRTPALPDDQNRRAVTFPIRRARPGE